MRGDLVHDKGRLHAPGLLVGVGHDAADKVGLGGVKRRHERRHVSQEHPGYSLGPAAFLLLTLLLFRWTIGYSN